MSLFTAIPKTTNISVLGSPTTTTGGTTKTASSTSSIENVIHNAVSSVSKIFSEGESALANATKSITSSLFGDSSTPNAQSGAVKTPISDPISSNFASGTPKATIFKTTNATTALTPTNLTGSVTSNNSALVASNPSLVSRYGTDIVSGTSNGGLIGTISKSLKNSTVTGLFSHIGSVTSAVSTVTSGATSLIKTAEGVISTGASDFRALVAGLATDLTGNELGLDGMYNSSLPVTANASGEPIDGIPSSMSTTSLSSIFEAAKSLGCEISNLPLNAYGAEQSLYAGLLGLASELNITSLLQNLLNCNRFDTNMQSIGSNLFVSYAGTNAPVASTLLSALPTRSVSNTTTLQKAIVSNPNVTTTQVSDVTGMMSTLNFTAADAMSSGVTINGQTVYDSSVLDAMTDPLLTQIDPTGGALTAMRNGTGVNSITAGTAIASTATAATA